MFTLFNVLINHQLNINFKTLNQMNWYYNPITKSYCNCKINNDFILNTSCNGFTADHIWVYCNTFGYNYIFIEESVLAGERAPNTFRDILTKPCSAIGIN